MASNPTAPFLGYARYRRRLRCRARPSAALAVHHPLRRVLLLPIHVYGTEKRAGLSRLFYVPARCPRARGSRSSAPHPSSLAIHPHPVARRRPLRPARGDDLVRGKRRRPRARPSEQSRSPKKVDETAEAVPTPTPRLSPDQLAELATIVETGQDRKVDGVVRWLRVDLKRVIAERFGVDYHSAISGNFSKSLAFSDNIQPEVWVVSAITIKSLLRQSDRCVALRASRDKLGGKYWNAVAPRPSLRTWGILGRGSFCCSLSAFFSSAMKASLAIGRMGPLWDS